MKKFIYLIAVALTAGCMAKESTNSKTPPTTAINSIHRTLQQDLRQNQAIASIYRRQNDAMNSALLQTEKFRLSPEQTGLDLPEKRFDISVNNAPAKNFLMGLVSGTGYNMAVSPDVTGTISLKLKNVTVEQTLQAVQDIYGYHFEKTSYGFEVLPPSLQTRIFHLNYLDIERNGRSDVSLSSTSLSSDLGNVSAGNASSGSSNNNNKSNPSADSGAQITTVSKHNFWLSLQTTLTAMIGTEQGRSVTVNPQAGIILVKAYPVDLHSIAQYLDQIQHSLNREVILEAKILEVQLNDGYQAGIDWQAFRFMQDGSNLATPVTDFGSFFSLTIGGSPLGQDGNFGAIIKLLEQQGNVQTLSSPRISTVNNQQAIIKVGTDDFFVTSVTSNVTPSSSTNTNSSSVGLTPFFSGITLDVTPEISEANDIVLHVHPSVSAVIDKTKEIDLGATAGKLVLPLAESTVRESDNIVRAQNGQIVVIGGLMQNNTAENIAATPVLSRIPLLGHLFRHTKQTSGKSELIILLRPIVINDQVWSGQLASASKNFCRLDRGFHLGSKPEIFGTRGETGY